MNPLDSTMREQTTEKYQCWLDEENQVISFHPVVNSGLHEFEDREEYMNFIMKRIDGMSYRIQ